MIDLKELDNDPWSTFPTKKDDLRALMAAVTMRDQFAMAALTSMLSPVQEITSSTPAKAAELAYQFADAMMEARK